MAMHALSNGRKRFRCLSGFIRGLALILCILAARAALGQSGDGARDLLNSQDKRPPIDLLHPAVPPDNAVSCAEKRKGLNKRLEGMLAVATRHAAKGATGVSAGPVGDRTKKLKDLKAALAKVGCDDLNNWGEKNGVAPTEAQETADAEYAKFRGMGLSDDQAVAALRALTEVTAAQAGSIPERIKALEDGESALADRDPETAAKLHAEISQLQRAQSAAETASANELKTAGLGGNGERPPGPLEALQKWLDQDVTQHIAKTATPADAAANTADAPAADAAKPGSQPDIATLKAQVNKGFDELTRIGHDQQERQRAEERIAKSVESLERGNRINDEIRWSSSPQPDGAVSPPFGAADWDKQHIKEVPEILVITGVHTDSITQSANLSAVAQHFGVPTVGVVNDTDGYVVDVVKSAVDKALRSGASVEPSVVSLGHEIIDRRLRGQTVNILSHSQGDLLAQKSLQSIDLAFDDAISQGLLTRARRDDFMQGIKVVRLGGAGSKEDYPSGVKTTIKSRPTDPIPNLFGPGEPRVTGYDLTFSTHAFNQYLDMVDFNDFLKAK